MRRGLLALALGVAWFGWAAEAVNTRLEAFLVAPRGQRTAADLRARTKVARLPSELRALVAEAEAAMVREEEWSLIVGSLLTKAERAEGLSLAEGEPVFVGPPGRLLEPELPILIEAILARYGPEVAPIPPAPRRDEWPTIDRRARVRALLALVHGPGLDEERAAVVLALTLDLLETQARRTEIEALLAEVKVR
ncbi:MAG: hypothetical protein Q8P18_31150 [Pseudomonadota bacterium]|nr:hypothetical protein [Pseudomonadota bacterium]